MTLRRAAGALLVALPLALIFAGYAANEGWLNALATLAVAAVLSGCLIGGLVLLDQGRKP